MIKSLLLFVVTIVFVGIFSGDSEEVEVSESHQELPYQLVWSDEFSEDGLVDSTKWNYDLGRACDLPCGCGWGNNELQFYTREKLQNARVENGHLIITAIKEKMDDAEYSSARLTTKNKGDWKYGRVEIAAQLPSGVGTWPAFWLLPTNNEYGGWPRSGEIDMMEHVGYVRDSIYGTVHTMAYNHMKGTQKGAAIYREDAEAAMNIYSIDWNSQHIIFSVNEKPYFQYDKTSRNSDEWPFDKAFHLIMNLAVGGNWGAAQGVDDSIWPQELKVDYVRVYKRGSHAHK